MATATRVPVELYLRTSYDPDAEFVDGEIEERPMGELNHASWQAALLQFFTAHAQEWAVRVYPELRVQVSETRFRVPDITVLAADAPREQLVRHPPLAVFEILSPEDTMKRLLAKLADYERMGIPHIWLIDPETNASYRFSDGLLHPTAQFDEAGPLSFPIDSVVRLLQ